ncbi:MAG: fasciclin domain-containing protein [Bacteroidales bacterium]|nr:fasciclin domain-containing protein [Bacteroidales bacterium]
MVSCRQELPILPFYEGIYEGMNESIAEYVMEREESYSMFGELLVAGSLDWTLTAYNPHGNDYTLFLPTNEAIGNFIAKEGQYQTFQDLVDDTEYVDVLVRYHIVNMAIQKNDFPFGALPDTTLSGDLLNIGFVGDLDSTVLKVNNEASIVQHDIELTNGYIHVIDKVLEPVVESSYEWLSERDEYSIFTQALAVTGLMNIFKIDDGSNGFKFPPSTVLTEPNIVFERKGIFSVDDLKAVYSPESEDYDSYTNGLYQFVAYHIIEDKKFLNNFEGQNTNYNTYASIPLRINGLGLDLKINEGVAVFDSIITGNDTTIINYIGIEYDRSNVPTKNGAIHIINNVLELFRPNPIERIFQFWEDPVIADARKSYGEYRFDERDKSKFEYITWSGVDYIEYIYSATEIPNLWGSDYLQINGDFEITYMLPSILPGDYLLRVRANDEYISNATIQVFVDGNRVGGNVDLTGNPNPNSEITNFDIGQVAFENYERHEVTIRALIPGRFIWDAIYFVPN